MLALAFLLRAAVLWRYAPMLDEDRDLYRQIAEQLVAGKGYSRPLQWEHSRHWTTFGLPGQFALVSDSERGSVVCWIRQETAIPADLVTGKWVDFPTAYRPPLYPMLLAGTMALFHSHRAIGVVQLFLGFATVGLTVCAARRMGLPVMAVVAGALVAADPL
ncbi:MAG: hypothetical protein EHM42_09320, partial [Planctomycetaceae bacterium]